MPPEVTLTIGAIHKLSGVLAVAIALTGCVLSIDPVVAQPDAIFDPSLLGNWQEVAGPDRAVVTRAGENRYGITYTSSDGMVGRFEARLGWLGHRRVLDIWPAPQQAEVPGPYAELLVEGHLLLALEVGPGEIRVAMLDPDSLRTTLRTDTAHLAHHNSHDRLILDGTTPELRTALEAYAARPGALREPDAWRHVPGTPPASALVRPVLPACYEASAWREADQLFHRDPHWVGADGASSVNLDAGRTLWLFGDTWIDPSGSGTRRGARLVSNTVAIQTGTNPSTSSIAFYWGKAADGGPAPLFPGRGPERLWLGNGIRVEDRLVLFLNRTIATNTGLGFESVGWTAVMVENPDDEPSAWRVTQLEAPPNPLGVVLGYAAVLRLGEYVYAFGSEDPVKSHPVYVARWPATAVQRGDLRRPEWWAGERVGWVPDSSRVARWPAFENGSSDLTVHFDEVAQQFVVVQSVGFGPADVAMRSAPELTGPWSAPRMVYRPPEYDRPHVRIYSAKAHPQLTGADLVLRIA